MLARIKWSIGSQFAHVAAQRAFFLEVDSGRETKGRKKENGGEVRRGCS